MPRWSRDASASASGARRPASQVAARSKPDRTRQPSTGARRRQPPLDRDALARAKREIGYARLSRAVVRADTFRTLAAARVMVAVRWLELTFPEFSARHGMNRSQVLVIALALICGSAAVFTAPLAALSGLMLAATLVFLLGAILRLVAIAEIAVGQSARTVGLVDLPTYAVLVPLFRETEIVADTVAAMAAIDYPPDRLDVILICEDDDADMLDVVAGLDLPPHIRVMSVPACHPRTKPKALNYALTDVTADLVVIYDAEDVPDPGQLRAAAEMFAASPPELGCLQARLNIYNVRDGWLTRQFTLEYSALFDGILPALDRLDLPLPLGGTSNHFRRHVLEDVGAWDPYNVTEDADLGLRLRRRGWQVRTLRSTTLEEAPLNHRSWCRQRSRWIKGWLQTYAVHMRNPWRLFRDFGAWPFFGFQLLALGLLATFYLHPLSYALIALEFARDTPFDTGGDPSLRALWWLAGLNFALGVFGTMALAAVAAAGRGHWGLLLRVPFMPIYWLLMSFAAYHALFQLIGETRAPIRWEKTAHRARRPVERARLARYWSP